MLLLFIGIKYIEFVCCSECAPLFIHFAPSIDGDNDGNDVQNQHRLQMNDVNLKVSSVRIRFPMRNDGLTVRQSFPFRVLIQQPIAHPNNNIIRCEF